MQLTSLSLAISRIMGGGVWSPLSLFAAGEQGAWYDPSDLSTLYHDAAGTTPVTAVEQRVGLMLDKSGRDNHAFQATTAPNDKRPILSARVNLLLATSTLSTQSVTTQATSYTLYFTGTGSITLTGTATGTYSAGSNTITCTAGTLTLTVSGSVLTADLRPANIGNNIPAYQRVNTATDYDTTGFPYYLKADGTYTSMSTNSINFSATNKVTMVSGVRKLSDTSLGMVSELSAISNSNSGSFATAAPGWATTAGTFGAAFNSASSFMYAATPNSFASPASKVISTLLDSATTPASNQLIIRVNASQQSLTINGSVNTGNYGNYPLYLFARNNSSNFFNGYFYGAIIRGATTSGTDLTNAEAYMNTQSGGLY